MAELTPGERQREAARLKDERAFMNALSAIEADLGRDVLLATTPEDREARWQEYRAINLVRTKLLNWAHGPIEEKD